MTSHTSVTSQILHREETERVPQSYFDATNDSDDNENGDSVTSSFSSRRSNSIFDQAQEVINSSSNSCTVMMHDSVTVCVSERSVLQHYDSGSIGIGLCGSDIATTPTSSFLNHYDHCIHITCGITQLYRIDCLLSFDTRTDHQTVMTHCDHITHTGIESGL